MSSDSDRSRSIDHGSGVDQASMSSGAAEGTIYVHKRTSKSKDTKQDKLNSYEVACQKLQLNAIPDELPCRDDERVKITEYIKQGLENKGSSSSLYVSGMPGTGKTVTTMQVIAKLRKKFNFDFLQINAMQLTNPNLVYTIIYEKITGRRVNPATAALFLDEFFKKKDKSKLLQSVWPK